MKVLLLQLEFPTWKTARPWTYGASFAVSDGLAANGVTCLTVPIVPDGAATAPDSWLSHARRMLAGQRFDQVWIWLVHASLDPHVLDWITTLAPVRVGFFMESLRYEEEDYRWAPELRSRHVEFSRQLQFLTHALLVDERDVEELTAQGTIPALWCPGLVPQRFITIPSHSPRYDRAVFHGSVYGARGHWIDHPILRQRMVFTKAPAHHTPTQQQFDRLQATAQQRLLQEPPVTSADLERYVREWHRIRATEFREWLEGLTDWPAIVNLPGLTRCFGGRVYEAMAVGRPVISWRIPNRPKANALFADGEEILLFSPDHPDSLAQQIDRVLKDPALGQAIGTRAQRKLLTYHTAEHRARHILRWIETGTQPDYGLPSVPASQLIQIRSATSVTPTQTESTTVFVLTIGDPAFEACQRALQQQTGTPFRTVIVKDVCPFSAAAQQMITSCETEFFIQLDEDMVLNPDAVATMEQVMRQAPDSVGMICFHLYDEDRDLDIQGVKIYRTALMKALGFQDVKASEMDLLEQMGRKGIQWILYPDVKGRHGTLYTPETIYRRYKTMYEKDIRQWNLLTSDIHRKANKFRETGDLLQLFALLGAAHGIIDAPRVVDREKDARLYNLKELEIFGRLFTSEPPISQAYDPAGTATVLKNPPIPLEQVRWKNATPPSTTQDIETQAGAQPAAMPSRSQRRVLIVTPYFWPSVGGVEQAAEMLGVGLISRGYAVDIATYPVSGRTADHHRGMTIITLAQYNKLVRDAPISALQVERLLTSGQYAACIMMGAPMNALFYGGLTQQRSGNIPLIIQPTMNRETYRDLNKDLLVLPLARRLMRNATALVALSDTGYDARWLKEEGLAFHCIPNGTTPLAEQDDFRLRYGISQDMFVILHVANLYQVKNHLGLLSTLDPLPPGSQLVIIGHETQETTYVAQVRRALAQRPDVLFLPGLPPDGIASAMRAADLLVLSSHAEAAPLCIVEAMSYGLAWMATPECGNVTELAGGIVAPLKEFPVRIRQLIAHRGAGQTLGDVGETHWTQSFRWDDILQGWIDLIETGTLNRSFATPAGLTEQTHAILEGLAHPAPLSDKNPERMKPAPQLPSPSTHEGPMDQNQFYVNMFVNSPAWSNATPNTDESARWSKIASFLEHIHRRFHSASPGKTLRMLEVGCGRGWLSHLASQYGTVEGVEPVAGVIDHARKLFPHIRFEVGTSESVLNRPDFAPYDVVLCSEVIEHVPNPHKPAFVHQLKQLLTPEGYLVLTTPRGEMWEQWKRISPPSQPVEDWITEDDLEQLFVGQGFMPLGLERISVETPSLRYIPAPTPHDVQSMTLLPIYQVWAVQRASGNEQVRRPSINRPPMVSVIIPTHNRPDRLGTALKSVLNQDYQDFQIIVVNDGTCPVEAVVAEHNRDGRITLVNHARNRGLAASRNTGLRLAIGKYICYLDDDDRFLPHHLRTLVGHLETGDCQVAYTDAWRVHERIVGGTITELRRDRPYSEDFNPHQLLIGNYIPVLCVMHARACLDEVGTFDESLFVHEDWDLWIRMATRYTFGHIPQTTAEFSWRDDGSTMTSQSRDAFLRTTEIIYRKYAPYAAKYPAIHDGQQKWLANLKHAREPKSYACSIIMPVWNHVDLTKQCLTALASATERISFELIVVDNGSTDGTKEFLASLGGDVRIITNEENRGFAKACNQGAAAATGTYLVFLNNDTIPQPGWLEPLVQEMAEHQDTAVVGSKLLYPDRTVQHAGIGISRMTGLPYHLYKGFDEAQAAVNRRRELNAVTGACMLVRREIFRDCGGFDEGFVNGFEDADLCLKIRERQGVIVYQPKSVLIHLESQTEGRDRHTNANGQRFLQRWGQSWWLVDDDAIYFDDGYKAISREEGGRLKTDLHLIASEQERQAWELVADTQRAAHHQDLPKVEALLQRHTEWPADPGLLQWALSVAAAMRLPTVADALRRRMELLNDPASQELEEIRAALANGQLPTAATRVDALLKRYPAHAEALLLRSILHMQREQYREAEIAFTTALNHGANRRKCLMGIGMASMGRAYPQGAWQTFLRVLAENPDDPEVVHWLLRAGTAQNRWRELSVQLRNFLARNPSDLSVRFAYAGVLLRADHVEAARQEYDQLRALAPSYEGLAELGQAIAGKETLMAVDVSNA